MKGEETRGVIQLMVLGQMNKRLFYESLDLNPI
jgi:hypothetical protein